MELTLSMKNSELFQDIEEKVIEEKILPYGQLREYPKGQMIFLPQQKIDQFGIILSGKVHIMHIFSDGNYGLMNVLFPPQVLGADLICTRTRIVPYHAAAALETKVLLFPAELLTQGELLEPELRLAAVSRLAGIVSRENMKKEYRLAILAQRGLRERVMTYLTMQANRLNSASFTIPLSREELAFFLCVNRSALSRELSLMQGEGLISYRKNVFTLLDWEGSKC